MYGRVFESMFTGSMQGSGAAVFAVWTYVIAKMREDKEVGVQVELRPNILAFYLGEKEAVVEAAIEKLCEPDPESTCQDEDGRRLIPVGKFSYKVVSGAHYIQIRNEDDLREYRRLAKRKERAGKKAPKSGLTMAERLKEQYRKDGHEREALRVEEQESNVPVGALGSYGPEAQVVVAAKVKRTAVGPSAESSGESGVSEASAAEIQHASAPVPPEDDMPDPDAVPVPEV